MKHELHNRILEKCRDEVARSKRNHPIANSRFENFEELQSQFEKNGFGNMLILAHQEAALLAMEELAAFYRWARLKDYHICNREGMLDFPSGSRYVPELEVYAIWERERNG